MQVPDADIEAVQELPRLEDLKKEAEGTDIKVRAAPRAAMAGLRFLPPFVSRAARACGCMACTSTGAQQQACSWALLNCADPAEADSGAEAKRRAWHLHGPGEGQVPAGGAAPARRQPCSSCWLATARQTVKGLAVAAHMELWRALRRAFLTAAASNRPLPLVPSLTAQVKNGKTFLDLIAEQIKYTRQKYGAW